MAGPSELKRALRGRGKSLFWLSRQIGAGAGTVYHWASGARRPGTRYALLLQDLLGLDPRVWHAKQAGHPKSKRKTVRLTTGQKPAQASSENPFELLGEDEQ